MGIFGLFESEEETYVATQVARAIPDTALPNSPMQGTLEAIIRDGNVSEHISESAIQSIASRSERMYAYAEKNYTYGLPTGETYSASQGRPEVQKVLDVLEGAPVTLEYCRYGPPNILHIGWMRLIEQYGYDPATNILGHQTSLHGKTAYLKDMVVVVPAQQQGKLGQSVVSQWGRPPTAGYTPQRTAQSNAVLGNVAAHSPIWYSDRAVEKHVLVRYVLNDRQKVGTYVSDGRIYTVYSYREGEFTIPVSDVAASEEYFHVKYLVGNQTKYWMYRVGSGSYPSLDQVYQTPLTEIGDFYPIAYFRHNKKRMDGDKKSLSYKTSTKMLKYIGIDYQMMIDAINKNSNIADVEQAMLFMAVPAKTGNPIEAKYLFDFFDAQYYAQDYKPLVIDSSSQANSYSIVINIDSSSQANSYSIVIKDTLSRYVLTHRGIYKTRKVGSIGAKGTHTSSFTLVKIPTVSLMDVDGVSREVNSYASVPCHFYRKQLTSGIYEEIQVIDLKMTYYVWGSYSVVADRTQNILLIPIDRNITKNYWMGDKEVLYARSLHYVFNSRTVVEVEWYEQEWFADLIKIVGTVITVISLGTQSWALAIAAAVTTGTVTALLITILLELLAMYLIGQALKLFVQVVGQDIAFLAAIIAAAYGINGVIEAGGLQAAAPMAQNMLSLANGLISAVGADIQGELQDLMGEFSEFDKYVEEQTKVLESAEDLLRTSQVLSPFVIFGESPEDFYKRTVHYGNIGTITTDAVGNYVKRSLTLPQLSHTLGEYEYG